MKATGLTKETIRNIDVSDRGFPEFNVGDTIIVSQRIIEGNKERIQNFEGDVIAVHGKGISKTFTIRKIGANAIGVEKIFPFFSPLISKIKFVRRGKVRRAKLFYMRDRIGKAARVQEKVLTKEEKEILAEKNKKRHAAKVAATEKPVAESKSEVEKKVDQPAEDKAVEDAKKE